MSRQEASQAELEEEEAISGTGEGDEVMEEQEEGYSVYFHDFSSWSCRSLSIQPRPHRPPLSHGSVGSVHCPDTSISAKSRRSSSRTTLISRD